MHFKSILLVLTTLIAFSYSIVLNPTILYPSANTKWKAGESYTVTWDTENVLGGPIPADYKGTIMLGYLTKEDGSNEHLKWKLASDFPLNQGSYKVTLPPKLETRKTYIIVLMGNSGNASKQFTILA
ncbi:unnamed protein product [Cunninghamella echinulata]